MGSASEDELAWVVGATKLSNGHVAVADRGLYQLRIYDRRAQLIAKSG